MVIKKGNEEKKKIVVKLEPFIEKPACEMVEYLMSHGFFGEKWRSLESKILSEPPFIGKMIIFYLGVAATTKSSLLQSRLKIHLEHQKGNDNFLFLGIQKLVIAAARQPRQEVFRLQAWKTLWRQIAFAKALQSRQ